MNVFYDASYCLSYPSGVGVYTASLLDEMMKLAPGLNVECGMTSIRPSTHARLASAIKKYSPRAAVKQKKVFLPKSFFNLPAFIARPFLFSREKYDVVHFTGFVCPRWVNFDSIENSILTIHDMFVFHDDYDASNPSFSYVKDHLPEQAARASAIIVNSEYTRREVLHFLPFVPENKISVTPLAVQNCSPEAATGNDFCARNNLKRFFLSVGPLSGKNHDKLIRAFLKFQKTSSYGKGDALVIAGHYYSCASELRELVRKSENVFFFEDVAPEDLVSLYKNALGFFLMSDREGFGIPLLEAMTCGCPACYHPGSAVDELARGKLFTADPDDERSMMDAFALFTQGGDEVEKSVAAGREIAKEYSWEKTALLTLEVYRETMKK